MKKAVLTVLIFMLVSLMFVGSVSALDKTRIYGLINPNEEIKFSIRYSNNNILYEQLITKKSNNIGLWEYTVSSDPGIIKLKVMYKGIEKEFSVPSGNEFKVNLYEEEANTTAEENLTLTELTEEANTTAEENLTEENITQGKKTLTGKTIFEKINLEKLNILFAIIGLFVLIVAANLVSYWIISFFSKPSIPKKNAEKIKIIKLSEKIAQAQKEIDKAKEEIEETSEEIEKA